MCTWAQHAPIIAKYKQFIVSGSLFVYCSIVVSYCLIHLSVPQVLPRSIPTMAPSRKRLTGKTPASARSTLPPAPHRLLTHWMRPKVRSTPLPTHAEDVELAAAVMLTPPVGTPAAATPEPNIESFPDATTDGATDEHLAEPRNPEPRVPTPPDATSTTAVETDLASTGVQKAAAASPPCSDLRASFTAVASDSAEHQGSKDPSAGTTDESPTLHPCAICPINRDDHGRPMVRSLEDTHRWAMHNLSQCPDNVAAATKIATELDAIGTTSSAFSGIACECIAINILVANLNRVLAPRRVNKPRYLAAMDNNVECQKELRCVPGGPRCIFGAIETFASRELSERIALEMAPYDLDRLMLIMNSRPDMVSSSAWCVVHLNYCEYPVCNFHCSGSPCTDQSTLGQMKRFTGKTAVALALWMSMRLRSLERTILFENVPGFDPSVLMRYLGRHYSMSTAIVDNLDFGGVVRRKRRYTCFTLRTLVQLSRELQNVSTTFQRTRDPNLTWRSLLVAKPQELKSEVVWARQRDSVAQSGSPVPEDYDNLKPEDYIGALNHSEKEHLADFTRNPANANKVVALAHNPQWCNVASAEDILHCLVRQIHLQWSIEFRRWFSARELLLAQTIPTTNSTLAASLGIPDSESASAAACGLLIPVTSFNLSRLAETSPRHKVEMGHQAGNGMDIATCGSVIMFIANELAPADVPAIISPLSPPAPGGASQDGKRLARLSSDVDFSRMSAADKWRMVKRQKLSGSFCYDDGSSTQSDSQSVTQPNSEGSHVVSDAAMAMAVDSLDTVGTAATDHHLSPAAPSTHPSDRCGSVAVTAFQAARQRALQLRHMR